MNTKPLERTKVITLRLKPKEHRWIVEEAEKMYVPLSAYVRHRLFGVSPSGIQVSESSERAEQKVARLSSRRARRGKPR